MNKQECAMVLAYLASAYPSASVSKETATVYFDVLKDLPFEACRDEARRLVRSSQWFPPAAVIRRGVCEHAGLLSKSADRAWHEVSVAVKDVGIYGQTEWSDAIIGEAVRTIGWREVCMSENQGVLRAHFFKIYEKIASSADAKIVGAEDLSKILDSGRKGLMSSEENTAKTLPEALETLSFAGKTEE
jgi:hypothetical protein